MTSLEQGVPTPTVKYRTPSVHPEGIKFVVIAAAITAALWWLIDWDILGWLMAGITCGSRRSSAIRCA
jgi:phosphatidylserine decarboxylase